MIPKMDFNCFLPLEEFKKRFSDDKFLFMGPYEEIPRHEKILYVIVQDIMPNIEFLKKYGSQMENLRIYCKSVNRIQPSIYAVISENCSENLKEIEFYDLEGDEINSFTKEFTKIERVQFKSGKIGQKVAEAFRKNFSKFHTLEFNDKLTVIDDRGIINGEYRNLKDFKATYDENGSIFNESDIKRALNLNKEHLRHITLWGELTPALLSAICDIFPQLERLSLGKVSERVMADPPG